MKSVKELVCVFREQGTIKPLSVSLELLLVNYAE